MIFQYEVKSSNNKFILHQSGFHTFIGFKKLKKSLKEREKSSKKFKKVQKSWNRVEKSEERVEKS